ncbi:membrane-bound transcription factor site-2 protease isoform X2 [Patella vulgata]|uniref:membrane-bound transcription factor site-2 protease isoform X2 n=1 Tax=Patella vulgata TaxID=6465 RepID=UPI0024A97071|nr:membrane-bound transcription factor site-2 protease isoform X2 [Patella vulgata]
MLPTTWIALVLGFWSTLYLLDAFLKTKKPWSRNYLSFLEKTGLSVSICQCRWYSNFFNRTFLRIGQWKPNILRLWFTVGAFFGLVAMLMSVAILTLLIVNTFRQQPVEQQVLTPVMPGINLPTSQIWYYLLTLLVCGILHEVGHAIAAVREQVKVNGFGLFLFVLYPGAYVDLSSEHLNAVSPLRQLRIYCAGVWHNFIIVIGAIIMLLFLPFILMPFYSTGQAVVITSVLEGSPVSGPRGLAVGEPLTSISGCSVTNQDEWFGCISYSIKERSLGHCMPTGLIHQLNTNPIKTNLTENKNLIDCCNVTSDTHLCFSYNTKSSPNTKFACLPARTTTDRPVCKLQSDCYAPKLELVCAYPLVDNQTKLLRINHGRKPPLLFLGHPLDLHYSVMVSNYVPNNSYVPIHLPYMVETFCKYLISLSGALVILNVVPCYALDGQFICHAFIELMFKSTVPDREMRGLIFTLIILYGTCLLGLNVVMAMWTLFFA